MPFNGHKKSQGQAGSFKAIQGCEGRIEDFVMALKKRKNIDPLYQLFEHYLLNRSYEDSNAFTKEVAEEYLAYLDSTSAHIPVQNRSTVLEDLEAEARELLVKKMYGCVRSSDYVNAGCVMKVKRNAELESFDFEPPILSEDRSEKN